MGLLGFTVVLWNNIIDFLLFWHSSSSDVLIPCNYISLIYLIYIPTVINYSIFLCGCLWTAEVVGCVVVLSVS